MDGMVMSRLLQINSRKIGDGYPPFVIAEIGINHEGDVRKAETMIDAAASVGCECVKFQCHVIEDEMIPNDVIPGNADESIWEIMKRCALTEAEDRHLKQYAESRGLIYLSTPFSRAAADRLQRMNVVAFKIGSGECNNHPLIAHIASFGKPIILSTGMNDLAAVQRAVDIIRKHKITPAILHCTSMYPTPYDKVRLGALQSLADAFPDSVIGLSDHSIGNYTSFAAVALGASVIEKHFTADTSWPGPDIPISIDTSGLQDLIQGVQAVFSALGGDKTILKEESPTIRFAYSSVVTIRPVRRGDVFSLENIWVKRPGTGEIPAGKFDMVLGKKAKRDLPVNTQVKWSDLE